MDRKLTNSTETFENNHMFGYDHSRSTVKALIKQGALILLLIAGANACSLDRLVNVDDPEVGSNIARDEVKSKKGAMGVYYSSIKNLSRSYSSLGLYTGLLSDELRDISSQTAGVRATVDNRYLTVDKFGNKNLPLPAYSTLQAARNAASQSRYLLRTYSDSTAIPFIAHAYVIEGYSILLLAEALCSGVPLSEAPFEGVVKYSSGVSTDDAFDRAIALFDSALSMTHDSLNFINLARVGKGRALINLGKFDLANEAVNDVPAGFSYNLTYTQATAPNSTISEAFWTSTASSQPVLLEVGVGNFEGINGLLWVGSSPAVQDPRVPLTTATVGGVTGFATPVRQNKFQTGNATVPLARTVDARLIQVEAAYHNNGGTAWLDLLNNLRATIGLPGLDDPGTPESRINMIFQERAYWNFLLGQRHGDLRRLIRLYDRLPENTFPTGTYHNIKGNFILYGEAVVFTPDFSEYERNHHFEGCENFNA